MPFAGGTKPMASDIAELILNRTWRPQLAVTGDGRLSAAGEWRQCAAALHDAEAVAAPAADLRRDEGDGRRSRQRWKKTRPMAPRSSSTRRDGQTRLERARAGALAGRVAEQGQRRAHFGKPVAFMGEGGSIPFMAMLGEKFPKTQFVVTGVLGPHSNAHGPNEFLHIPTAKKVSACIAAILADHAVQAIE